MKVLLVALEWPFPPQNGGAIATATLVRALAGAHDVTVFSLNTLAEGQAEVLPEGEVQHFGLPCRRPRNLATYLQSWLKGLPLSVFRNWQPEARDWLNQHAQAYDLLLFDHLIPAQYHQAGMPPAILVEQNAEFSLWERAATAHPRWYLRPLLRLEAWRMRTFEQRACRSVQAVVTLTPEDAALLAPLAPGTRFEVIPPCLMEDPRKNLPPQSRPPGSGCYLWAPSRGSPIQMASCGSPTPSGLRYGSVILMQS